MSPTPLFSLPEELICQIFSHIPLPDLYTLTRVSKALNTLTEPFLYHTVNVIKHLPPPPSSSHSPTPTPSYTSIRAFFSALKSRPARAHHIRHLDATLELRLDPGVSHAVELFAALGLMERLSVLRIEICGGVRPRDLRSLEQSMIWGCTFERGRNGLYRFFRMGEEGGSRGLHALVGLRELTVVFPADRLGIPTDLMLYSALQHPSIKTLRMSNIAQASLKLPQLPAAYSGITHLELSGCNFTLPAWRDLCGTLASLKHFGYSVGPKSVDYFCRDGLVDALAPHVESLKSLCLTPQQGEMYLVDLSLFVGVRCLTLYDSTSGIKYHPQADDSLISLDIPASFPPFLEQLTLRDFHIFKIDEISTWLDKVSKLCERQGLPHLKILHLQTERQISRAFFETSTPVQLLRKDGNAVSVRKPFVDLGERFQKVGIQLRISEQVFLEPEKVLLGLNWRYDGSEKEGLDVDRARVDVRREALARPPME